MTTERLYELRKAVEDANETWFESLRAGLSGADERAVYNDAKAAFRSHEAQVIEAGLREVCGRCGGDGVVHWGRVTWTRQTQQGAATDRFCFECGGARTVPVRKARLDAQASTRFKRWREAQAKEAAAAAERAEKWTGFAAEHAEEAALLVTVPEDSDSPGYDHFLASLKRSVEKFGSLTEKQMEALRRSLVKFNEQLRLAEARKSGEFGPLVGGKREVEGQVVSIKSRESQYGTQTKMVVVMDDGNKVWGTVPEAFWRWAASDEGETQSRYTEMEGQRVKFTATVERSDDDKHFGFFKRPTKFTVLDGT